MSKHKRCFACGFIDPKPSEAELRIKELEAENALLVDKPSNVVIAEQKARIKELETILEGSKGTVWYATVGENNELKAENRRLRDVIMRMQNCGYVISLPDGGGE